MFNLNNLKIVKELKNIQPKLKWLMFSEMQDYKLNSRYYDIVSDEHSDNVQATEDYLSRMVRESLIREFSPEIRKSDSFELLADMVLHNLKKKQLEEMDIIEDQEA